jgi:regulator of ribonuclease activity A
MYIDVSSLLSRWILLLLFSFLIVHIPEADLSDIASLGTIVMLSSVTRQVSRRFGLGSSRFGGSYDALSSPSFSLFSSSINGVSISSSTQDPSSSPRTSTPPADTARGATADLCDVHVTDPVDVVAQCDVQICSAGYFQDFGGHLSFKGRVSTIKCFENNPLVRKALEESGHGRVLVVDGGASKRCALLGDNIAEMAYKNGWSGIIINGCIRDSADIGKMPLGVKAISTYPLKSSKRDVGLNGVPVSFAGVTFEEGDWVHADKDGVLVSKKGDLSVLP